MEVLEVACRSILTRATGYLNSISSHSLNPYVGCGFGKSACGVGCYVQSNNWITKGRPWGEFVEVKVNAREVYLKTYNKERCWARKQKGKFSVFLSSSTDPWQPIEKKYRITRGILKAFQQRPPDKLVLQTHGTGILDDLELIYTLNKKCDLNLHLSIEGDINRLPGLPPPPSSIEDRLDVLKKFIKAKIKTVVCLSPLFPLKEPEKFFSRLARMGTDALIVDHFILGDGTKNGGRTLKTELPKAMAQILPESLTLDYRNSIIDIAKKYLPVGISADGFSGKYSTVQS